jgi:tRNA pseudouridine38-40 synthase
MVRIIVGTLIEVAHGRIAPESITDIISSRDRSKAGMTAPPEGLYLNKVSY